jgi:hypothetical protein
MTASNHMFLPGIFAAISAWSAVAVIYFKKKRSR